MNQDLHNNVVTKVALNGQTINSATTTQGNIIDTQYYNALEFVIGVDAYTSGTVTPLIEEGDQANLSDAAAVDANYILGDYASVAGVLIAANTQSRLGYIGVKRYVRLSLVTTGSVNLYAKASAVMGHPHTAPTPFP